MGDTLRTLLAARGFTVDEEFVNSRGRVQLIISGPGLERFGMYQTDAEKLAAGELTPDDLHAAKAHLARSRS